MGFSLGCVIFFPFLFLVLRSLVASLSLDPHVQVRDNLLTRDDFDDASDLSLFWLDLVMVAVIFPDVLASTMFDAEASERRARRKCSRIAIVKVVVRECVSVE